jgi:hypothetical protein
MKIICISMLCLVFGMLVTTLRLLNEISWNLVLENINMKNYSVMSFYDTNHSNSVDTATQGM